MVPALLVGVNNNFYLFVHSFIHLFIYLFINLFIYF